MAECSPCDASGSALRFGLLGQTVPRSVEERLAALEARPVPYAIEYGLSLPQPSSYSGAVLFSDLSVPALYAWREVGGQPTWQRLSPYVRDPDPVDLSGYLTESEADGRYLPLDRGSETDAAVGALGARVGALEAGCVTRDALSAMGLVDSSALAAALSGYATEAQAAAAVEAALASYSRVTPEELAAAVSRLLAGPSAAAASMVAGLGGSESDSGLVSAAQTLLALLDAYGVVRRTGGNAALPAPGAVGSLSADSLLSLYAPAASLSGLVTQQGLASALSAYATLASLQDVVRYREGSDSDGEGNAYWNLLCTRLYADGTFATKAGLEAVADASASAEVVRLMSLALGAIGGGPTVARRLELLEAGAVSGVSGGLTLISDGVGSAARLPAVAGTAVDTDGGRWQLVLQDGFRLVPVQRAVQADPDAAGFDSASEGSGCLWDVAAAACYAAMRGYAEDALAGGATQYDPGDGEFWGQSPFLAEGATMEFLALPWHVLIPEPGVSPYRDSWLGGSDSDGGSESGSGAAPQHARRFSLSLPYVGSPSTPDGHFYCRLGGTLSGSVESGEETLSYSVALTGASAPFAAYVAGVGFTVDPRQVTASGRAVGRPVTVVPGRGVGIVDRAGGRPYVSAGGHAVVASLDDGLPDGLSDGLRLVVAPTGSWTPSMSAGGAWPWVVVDFTEVAPDTFLVTAEIGETAVEPSRAFAANTCDSDGAVYGSE